MLAHILTAAVAVFALSAAVGLFLARAMHPSVRIQPKPNHTPKGGNRHV